MMFYILKKITVDKKCLTPAIICVYSKVDFKNHALGV